MRSASTILRSQVRQYLKQFEELIDWMAHRLEELWKWQFDSSGKLGSSLGLGSEWKPLSSFTIYYTWMTRFGRNTPLVDTGELRDSLRVDKVDELQYKVSFSPPSNGVLVQMMELGYSASVTPKMRRWFAVQGINLKHSTKKIVVPARPILGPILEIINREAIAKSMEIFGENKGVWIQVRWH